MVASIDTEALRRKYAAERDKRLRPDGNDQYLRLTGELAHYLDDPHTPRTERAAITDHRTVVCVGGGFAGLVAAARLREAGVDVRIIEKGGGFGGARDWKPDPRAPFGVPGPRPPSGPKPPRPPGLRPLPGHPFPP